MKLWVLILLAALNTFLLGAPLVIAAVIFAKMFNGYINLRWPDTLGFLLIIIPLVSILCSWWVVARGWQRAPMLAKLCFLLPLGAYLLIGLYNPAVLFNSVSSLSVLMPQKYLSDTVRTGTTQEGTPYQGEEFSFVYPKNWSRTDTSVGVTIVSPGASRSISFEVYDAATFKGGFECIEYRYETARKEWKWIEYGSNFPNCSDFSVPQVRYKTADFIIGSRISAFIPDTADLRPLLVVLSDNRILRILVHANGYDAVDPEEKSVLDTLNIEN